MARTSRYRIELSDEDRLELERRAAALTLPFRVVQRARLILYAAEGLADKEIAVRCGCHPQIVSKWRRRFCEQGIEGLKDRPRAGRPRRFPPQQVAEVVAVACELPARHDRPLGRFSRTELHRLVIEQGVTDASASALVDLPRDPDFQSKAGRVLDLYQRRLEGRLLHPGDFGDLRR